LKPVFFMSVVVACCMVASAAVNCAACFDSAALPKASL
jgi:hypothetical protein